MEAEYIIPMSAKGRKKSHVVTLSVEVVTELARRFPAAPSFDAAIRSLMGMTQRKRIYTGLTQFARPDSTKPAA